MNEMAPPIGESRKSSAGKKWAIGCGIGCAVILILLAVVIGIGVFAYKKVMKQADEWAVGFEAQGYERVTAQALQIHDAIDTKRVYVGQMIQIFGPVNTDIAIVAQMAEIHGPVKGDLSFRGQVLTLQPGAVIEGNVDAKAQVVQVNSSVVMGEITGEHQLVDNGMRRQLDAP